MSLKSILILVLCSAFTFSCKKINTEDNITVSEIKFKHEGNLQILGSTNTVKKELKIEIADNDFEHQTGLMYRKQMDTDKAMLFIFEDKDIRVRSFYMKNTYIALDLIFISADKKIINISKNAKPLNESSLFSEAPAKYVLEINAGLSDTWGLKAGDFMQYTLINTHK